MLTSSESRDLREAAVLSAGHGSAEYVFNRYSAKPSGCPSYAPKLIETAFMTLDKASCNDGSALATICARTTRS